MRLKTFHAKTMQDVMEQVRQSLGPDAIIISIEEGKNVGGVRITAALEADATPPVAEKAPMPEPTPVFLDDDIEEEGPASFASTPDYDKADIKAVISHHNLPYDTAERLYQAVESIDAASLPEAFAFALETMIRISPLTDYTARPIMLVGPAGAGKTVCTAKLAADALLHERGVNIISTDVQKAGGIQQLDHFSQLMKQSVQTAENEQELSYLLKQISDRNEDSLTVIDTMGINPFDIDDLEASLKIIKASDAEPVLVLPAGMEPTDAAEIAGIYQRIGCQRFILSRADAARRFSGLITASRPGGLSIAAISRSPFIADGLEPASSFALGRLLTSLPRSGMLSAQKKRMA
ncbi:hypothetical protein QGN29_14430 [Temperatibacter marinus]|uniref:SRP54-type proteins GTP-binding domain-containing protein n=1 Tax=Temperatibacter marinus TaxID=1456591 RepID=A0AA52EI52_9PROT|nr:hypothetical protein [Temperatibacter marinus]WND02744.1 hypothetical protein QGN29_14430 [Temperatibacter marinus]